jgi:uncharacterized protein
MSNRLIEESSPYLQMHSQNPINWYPWGPEAFEKAKNENKLLIVSIGYAACHWCHVMEKESFSDPAASEMMNKYFIAVKVDREERPDVDELYMSAIQLIGGRGGWPLNAFTLPNGRPLYVVTYLPAAQWLELLIKIKDFYNKSADKAIEQALQIEDAIIASQYKLPEYLQNEWPESLFTELFERWFPYMDIEKGGYLNAPKFPLPVSWEFLLQFYTVSKDQRALTAVNSTLDNMGRGGIFDQLGGGFSRYSIDVNWKVPHFEKMLYDNAQLVSLYSHAYQLTHDEFFSEVIRKTLGFVEREFTSPNAAFYTSLDADSEEGEGTYYTWISSEFDSLLGENSILIKEFYSVIKQGNWENGKNILHCRHNSNEFANNHSISLSLWEEILQVAQNKLIAARELRPKPALDDKILTSWNALMIIGFIDAFHALDDKHYLEMALKNARFLKQHSFSTDGTIKRNLKPGKTQIPGFLDDYAYLAEAWISLYQSTLDRSWLDDAMRIVSKAIQLFEEPSTGLLFYTPDRHAQSSIRTKIIQDNVMPSPLAIMAKVMHLIGVCMANPDLIARSETLCKAMIPGLVTGGPYMAVWSSLILNHSATYKEVDICGPAATEWANNLQRHYLPEVIIYKAELNNKLRQISPDNLNDTTYAIVCSDKVCGMPIYSYEELLKTIYSKENY